MNNTFTLSSQILEEGHHTEATIRREVVRVYKKGRLVAEVIPVYPQTRLSSKCRLEINRHVGCKRKHIRAAIDLLNRELNPQGFYFNNPF